MRKIFVVLMLVVSSLISGCTAFAPPLPQNIIERSSKFEKGKTTYAEVVRELGEPQNSGFINDERRIAYIDGYYGGNKLLIVFDKNDVITIKSTNKF